METLSNPTQGNHLADESNNMAVTKWLESDTEMGIKNVKKIMREERGGRNERGGRRRQKRN